MTESQSPSAPSGLPERLQEQDRLFLQRAAIDLLATTRTRIVRCAYAGQVTARPDPVSARDPARRRARLDTLSGQLAAMERVAHILGGTDPDREFDAPLCTWIAEIARQHRDLVQQFPQVNLALRQLFETAADHLAQPPEDAAPDLTPLDRAIGAYIDATDGMYARITSLCEALWLDLDAGRKADLDRARRSRGAIDETLALLEKIGKHVRLVSLNASVEASRAGEAGKGLAVIAVEFKSLAEDIQTLAANARRDMEDMT